MSSSTTVAILKLLKLYENRSCADCEALLNNAADVSHFFKNFIVVLADFKRRSSLLLIMELGCVPNALR